MRAIIDLETRDDGLAEHDKEDDEGPYKRNVAKFYHILRKYNTSDEYISGKVDTKLSLFLNRLSSHCCSVDEALRIYLLTAEAYPDHRWAQYSRRLCPTSSQEWESALLRAYLQSTTLPHVAFFRMLWPNFTAAAALSVSAMDILYLGDFSYAGVSRWVPGTHAFLHPSHDSSLMLR